MVEATTARAVESPARTRAGARPKPQRNPEFAHLTLTALRAYRLSLSREESRVSYWRRLIQARLDVLEAQASDVPGSVAARGIARDSDRVERLRGVLAEVRPVDGRTALLSTSVDDVLPLPDLEELWSREVHADDEDQVRALRTDLAVAELQLSAYRGALHRQLGAATAELVARYHEDPQLCLSALPFR
ncbi:MAG TPA: hypothetical protein VMI11_07390 [Actinomycetes bacterium]|nr:hypothetical protein [Actinomycetes bacterium]